MIGFRKLSPWRGLTGQWDSHRMDWRHTKSGVKRTRNRMIAISCHRGNKDCWSGRLMEEERYKSNWKKIIDVQGEGNDTKNFNMVVYVAGKGSWRIKMFRERIFSLEMCWGHCWGLADVAEIPALLLTSCMTLSILYNLTKSFWTHFPHMS